MGNADFLEGFTPLFNVTLTFAVIEKVISPRRLENVLLSF